MTKKVICPICGKEWETKAKNAKYCSLTCRAEGERIRRKIWEDKNPNYSKMYMRTYAPKKQDPAKVAL